MSKLKPKNNKTSLGGYIFIGLIIFLFLGQIGNEQYRKYGERKALKYGIETICTITEIHNIKSEFVIYYYKVNGKEYCSSKQTIYYGIVPGEKYYIKFLIENPRTNMIQFDKPYLPDNESIIVKGTILEKSKNNVVFFNYKYQGKTYERWQLLRQNHFLATNDSVEIAISKDKPEIGIIRYENK